MIRHCVFIRFREDVPASQRQACYDDLAALCARLPGALAFRSGVNASPEAGMDKGYCEGFILDFTDAAARDAYLADPEHRAIGGRIVSSAAGGPEGVFVFDLEI